MRKIKKVLVANRGEIAIRVFRSCNELGIKTVAIYSNEDILSLHRYKSDEAYLVGAGKKPVEAYLDIESIINIAKNHQVDAIHPGYGFLAENRDFAKRCREEGIIFIGPDEEHLHMFGDKINARKQAEAAGLQLVPGSKGPVSGLEEVKDFAQTYGFPLIIKASHGGGGRGMRIVRTPEALEDAYYRARSEAQTAFGNDEVYIERLLESAKHIEVQILGDLNGEIIHLYERDCSVQRRHQKVVEIAPSLLPLELRIKICDSAIQLMKNVKYFNAGTVEFLVSPDEEIYFLEVNPRIQVEHTITELITGIDIVQSQILIAEGYSLQSEGMGIPAQEKILCNGFAIQCRITTEDPEQNFMPDTGRISVYRSSGGFGIRLDAGNAYAGSVITPYYDSLLVKASTWSLSRQSAIAKMRRTLGEFRIRGLKTNIAFLDNVMKHEAFQKGNCDTTFIDHSPELFVFQPKLDRGSKLVSYLGNVIVNGFPGIPIQEKPKFATLRVPTLPVASSQSGSKQILDEKGPEGLAKWVKEQKQVLLTDTTFRDAHQSLLATRVRTKDIARIAKPTAELLPQLFSSEMWGGATFDVAYLFLHEDPWERLESLRKDMPNVLFQMLLRGANGVGYTNYPDNVIRHFVKQSADSGIDVFRIFDSLNWIEGMRVAIDAVREENKVAEASICYTGDICDNKRVKYDLGYYVKMAKELEQAGAHILAVKDMAGLLKPEAGRILVSALKDAVDIPIHLHCHDTSGNIISTYVKAIEAGVDIVDVAMASMAGGTSQPSASTLFYALEHDSRRPDVNIEALTQLSRYWEDVRCYYKDFDNGVVFPDTEVYQHEMPGGQYTNLKQQAKAVGLESRWDDTKVMYRKVNDLFGDVVKVTPSSKVVGDMALYMIQNNLKVDDIYEKGESLDFPNSVVEFFQGQLGQPYQGFPKDLQRIILKGQEPLTVRPGELMDDTNFEDIRQTLKKGLARKVTEKDVLAYALYPQVFEEWMRFNRSFGNVAALDTPDFFYGLSIGEEIRVEIEEGKMLVIKLIAISLPNSDGMRMVNFELNGLPRDVEIKDNSVQVMVVARAKVDKEDPKQIGATMPGTVLKVLVQKGGRVKKGEPLLVTEAMKMETTLQAPFDGMVKEICVKAGEAIRTDDLLMELSR